VDIQDEVADIMEDKTSSAQKLLLNMFDVCKDELETIIQQTLLTQASHQGPKRTDQTSPHGEPENLSLLNIENFIQQMIDEKFGPRPVIFAPLDFAHFFSRLYRSIESRFKFRNIQIDINIEPNLPDLVLPEEILNKMISGLIKNAVENTPDGGRIDIAVLKKNQGILVKVHDFGVGIEDNAKKRIFEGFFTTQKTLLYSTKTPFTFNAGGKGADLLRMKIFSRCHGFIMAMESERCSFLLKNQQAICPGDIEKCTFCQSQKDCLNSGHSVFSIFFPPEHK
jgi:signal transduction histidine kinase